MPTKPKATIEDLFNVPEKAEIVNGEIVRLMPTGGRPGYAADEVFVSLRQYALRAGRGRAVGDNKGFIVYMPNRESFSPDAAYYDGPDPGMKFYEGAPNFAVEVRSEGDYGARAERELADKRSDYFLAGTKVVWDVDLRNNYANDANVADDAVVRKYSTDNPVSPAIFRRGQLADAESAVPGWTMPVDDLFTK